MKKYSIYFAFSAFTAIFFILAACGSGEIVDLSNGSETWEKVYGDSENLKDIISSCKDEKKDDPMCEVPSSSSTEDQPLSSADVEPYSSSDGSPASSSSSISTSGSSSSNITIAPSSSSSRPPASSSSQDPDAYQVSTFTCEWEPNSVTTGKTASIKITLAAADQAEGVTCTKKAWLPERNSFGLETGVELPLSEESMLVRFGGNVGGHSNTYKFPDEPTGAATSATFDKVKATVTCSGNGKPAGNKPQTCTALTITKAPQASTTEALAFTNGRAGTGATGTVFFIGDTPERNTLILTNNDAKELCGDIEYVNSWAGDAVTAAGNITITAKCTLSGQELRKATATVVANPSLSACAWNKDILPKGQEAIPTATISNSYGRCGAVQFSGGFPKVLTDTEVAASPISDVKATADCGSTVGTLTQNCPALTVKSAMYELTAQNTQIAIPNEPTVIEMKLPANWHNTTEGDATFVCNAERLISGTIGTGGSAVTISGSDYATAKIPIRWTIDNYSLAVSLACENSSCKCGISW